MRAAGLLLALALGGAAGAAPLVAQQTVINRSLDSLGADSVRRADSVRLADTLSTTERLLRAQRTAQVLLRPLPLPGTVPLQPRGARIVLTRDSIDWATALDLGELLARVPGMYLERADWNGAAVLPNYRGRGAASVEYVLDGVPLLPLGVDSVAVDPSTMPLDFLERVEIERSPSLLRVELFTRRHDREAPRTAIGVAQGDRGTARYFASFERRYTSGLGLGLAANYAGLNAKSGAGGKGGAIKLPSGWAQLSYVPSPHFGVQGEWLVRSISRGLLLNPVSHDTLTRQEDGSRVDASLRASWHARDDALGPRVDLFAATTRWSGDSAPGDESFGSFGGIAAWRHPTWSAQLSGWHHTRWTSLDSRLLLGWSPLRWFTTSLEFVAQQHTGDRKSQWSTARAHLDLPFGFFATGALTDGHRVQSPALADDLAQRYTDYELGGGFGWRVLAADARLVRNTGWRPQAYPEFVAIPQLGPNGPTDWLSLHARWTPLNFLTFETVYDDPIRGVIPEAVPPHHALSTATLRSRFLRNFPSGVFDLKLQVGVESWSPGIGGRDTVGVGIPLPGATFIRTNIELSIGSFIAYYDRNNLRTVRTGYVPGYPIQIAGTTFGIRWRFSN